MKYYIVDAFADKLFSGNQAGVCILDHWIEDNVMQSIAAENNLAETAFVIKHNDTYDLRWFTPEVEIDLCGHATLASAFILSEIYAHTSEMVFNTASGILNVKKTGELYEMDFPKRVPIQVAADAKIKEAIGAKVLGTYLSRDLLVLVDSQKSVSELSPDMQLLSQIPDCFAVIVTAKGQEADFVSRFFAPNAGIPEDPVTGSSHSTLIPFWAERLGKDEMTALQLSKRGGTLYCKNEKDRVKIAGRAVLYLEGEIRLSEDKI